MSDKNEITDLETGAETPIKDIILNALQNNPATLKKDDLTIVQINGIPAGLDEGNIAAMKQLGHSFSNGTHSSAKETTSNVEISFGPDIDPKLREALRATIATQVYRMTSCSQNDITIHDTDYETVKASLNGLNLQPAIRIVQLMQEASSP